MRTWLPELVDPIPSLDKPRGNQELASIVKNPNNVLHQSSVSRVLGHQKLIGSKDAIRNGKQDSPQDYLVIVDGEDREHHDQDDSRVQRNRDLQRFRNVGNQREAHERRKQQHSSG
uniref:Uncharacterized protein n=1 Tax=Photinus pyralis TaxID=7054 RepID=A0A1Y1KJ00_PHOPY